MLILQRTRIANLKDGDANTAFSTGNAPSSSRKKRFFSLTTNGMLLTEHDEMA